MCRRWKNKKLLFSLDLDATVSDLLGDDVSVSVTWILTALRIPSYAQTLHRLDRNKQIIRLSSETCNTCSREGSMVMVYL